jgi:thiamine kinase-like enzyme
MYLKYLKRIILLLALTLSAISSALADSLSYPRLLEHNLEYADAIEKGIRSLTQTNLQANNSACKENFIFETLNGGFTTTKLYIFQIDRKKYVLRLLPKKSNSHSRINEIKTLAIASKLDIAPELKYSNPESGIVITSYIQGHTLTKKDLANKKVLKELAKMLKKLHAYSGESPQNRTQIERACKHYTRALSKHIAYPTAFKPLYDEYIKTDEKPSPTVLCHGDLNPSNILVTQKRLYIIDWASSTRDDPYTDLGYLTLLSGMNKKQSQLFLDTYLGRKATKKELLNLCLAEKRITFLTAVVWFDFSESLTDQKNPLTSRIQNLDRLLESSSLKKGREYIKEGVFVNPKTASTNDIRLYALGFLKDYMTWKCPKE